ncbi:MAG: DUF4855 domain-containing protein [Thermoproteota archaeon]
MFTFTSTSQSLSPDITPPKNIVLVYSDSREGVYMTKDQLLPLVVYFKDSRAIDTFFDGFLFLGITGPSGGSYETGTANDKDWSWLLNRLLGSKNQVENLQDAAKEASKLLGKEITLKVIIVIPLPDPNLNFSERISKVRKYVDNVIDKFKA